MPRITLSEDLTAMDEPIKQSKEERAKRAAESQAYAERFIRVYMTAINGGGTIENVNQQLGTNGPHAAMYASQLRKRGVPLPYFPKRPEIDTIRLLAVMKEFE